MNESPSAVFEHRSAPDGSRRRDVLLAIGGLGFTAATAQLALMRELLGVFAGNELSLGVTLACWLLLTAAGTWIGAAGRRAKKPVRHLALGCAWASLLPVLEIGLTRGLRHGPFLRGAAIDPVGMTAASVGVLAPFCLASGALLSLACRALARDGDDAAVGRVYAADAFGSILGAAAFTFLLGPTLDHAALLGWTAAAMFALATAIAAQCGARRLAAGAATVALATGVAAACAPLDAISTAWQQHGTVVARTTSPYGRLMVTRNAGQLTFIENGVPVIYSANAVAVEEAVHYALAQRPDARDILLIGGGVEGAAREALRYRNLRDITCVELDPRLLALGRRLLPQNLEDSRIHPVLGDGRQFVRSAPGRFDAVLIALPDPTTLQLNRYFTTEFFAEVKRVLTPGGIVAFGLGRYENYVSPELGRLLASADRSLRTAFAQVVTIPGGRVYFLGSDAPLARNVAPLLEARGITPRLVNRGYLDAMLTPDRLADIDSATALPAPLNRDFHPVLYALRVRQWLAQFSFPAGALAASLGIVLVGAWVRLRWVPRMVFAAGFAGATLEIALLVTFQVFYGSVYRQVGVILALFMAGLAAGAAAANRGHVARPATTVRHLGFAITGISLVLAGALPRLGALDGALRGWPAGAVVIAGLTFALAVAVGAQFALAAAIQPVNSARTAPRIFSADLLGAALGALAVSTFLLPLLGVPAVCLLTAGLNLVTAALRFPRRGYA